MQQNSLIENQNTLGEKYLNSRHNIGWMVASSLANKYNVSFKAKSRIYLHCEIEIAKQKILNVLPTTYMNNSGEAILSILKKIKVDIENIIVVVDEYNFPLGKVHAKSNGGDGGHNGISSVIEHLDSTDFIRIRCGIDRKFSSGGLVDYVLSPFDSDESFIKNKMIEKAVLSIETIVKYGKARALSMINSGELWQDDK